jgi:hypothetical protein
MALLGRIFVVIFAYLAACLVAALVLIVASRSAEWDEFLVFSMQVGTFWPLVGVAAAAVAVLMLIPAMLFVALAEGFGWQSVFVYAGVGIALALSSLVGFVFYDLPVPADSMVTPEREALAAAGIAGGLVYWLIAGRKAGAWRSPQASLPKPSGVG